MRRTRDELVEEFHEDEVEYWERRIEEGETGRRFGFGRDATLWELLYLDAGWIHEEFRQAYERATRDHACPIWELPDWARESWSADEMCRDFPCPTCASSPFEEIHGMTPEEYLDAARQRQDRPEGDGFPDDEIPF